ncbi:MarR family transcriptional regulator [Reichenbachiella carrageenanivorans]|uniref:MarR family transcriptional regulator n=1 Tax=Reichenbachiella carrageenanivorans TaxID=2979869 RepID=A0ABY6CY23_9BACT|nr:MarR family transcriptional regulator [Reichenbachiella carrageenanivorans]UXX78624.1 MarR family transcriptional regulator [Reichenbachiella carrageenanivorans]
MDSLEILVSIRKIVRSLNLESKSIQKDFGLSITQLLCLGHLEKSPNYQSNHRELMNLLSLNSSTVTGIINRLEKRGYVIRMPKQGDKRMTYITLTASGIKLLEETPNVLHERLAKKLDLLSNDERGMVRNSLEIITSAMQIHQLDASPLLTPEDPID